MNKVIQTHSVKNGSEVHLKNEDADKRNERKHNKIKTTTDENTSVDVLDEETTNGRRQARE